MADRPLQAVLRYIHRRVEGRPVNALTDRDLLDRYVANGDQAAFTALVDRHGPMVLGVCRRVLRRDHDAEDAFQAAFLVLARKAASIRKRNALASWLHGVAYHAAANLRRAESRRGAVQAPRSDFIQEDVAAEVSWREVRAAIDEELALLPQRYRAPLVLCYLEGRTRDEAAQLLGWSEGTLRGRLERGRDALRKRLIRRGIGLSAVLLAGTLHEAATAAPVALVAATVAAAMRFAGKSATTGLISARVASLTQGVLKAMFVSKVKTTAVVLLILGATALGGVMLAKGPDNKQSDKTAKAPVHAASETPAPPAAASGTMGVVVLDPQGKPLPGAKIYANISFSVSTGEVKIVNQDLKTDDAGFVQVELPKNTTCVRMWASAKPFVTLFANWEENELASGKGLPAEYTFRLQTGLTVGGRVVDEEGKPIEGAKVQVSMWKDVKLKNGDGRVRYDAWTATGSDAATTGAEGRWHIDDAPNSPEAELWLLVSHPDYVSDSRWQESQRACGVTTAMLLKGTADVTLKRGVVIQGRVTDPDGKPIKDALVVVGDNPNQGTVQQEFPTDAEGQFRLPTLAPGEKMLTVVAHGWAPQLRKVNVRSGLPPQDFHLAPGKAIRLRIFDAAGKPIPKTYVTVNGWKGATSLQSIRNSNFPKVPNPKIPGKADADGVYEWTWAPDDPVKLIITSTGFANTELEIAGGAPERIVTLKAKHRVTGRVTDATTGKPIPAFTVIPVDVFGKDFLGAERGNAKAGQDGRLDYLAERVDIPLRLRIEAMGYRTQDGLEFRVGDDAARTQDFRLRPCKPVVGVVVDVAGKPVANAEVLLATPTEQTEFSSGWDNHKAVTDAAGRFAFPDPGERWAVLARSDAGYARAEFSADRHDAGKVSLQPWASIHGQFNDGGKPVRGATIFLRPIRIAAHDGPNIVDVLHTVTDADGRFDFPQTPPGPVSVEVSIGPWKDYSFHSGPRVPLELKPGQHADLDLGSGGTVVTGKVVLTGKVPADLNCTYSINYLVPRERGITPPPEIAALGFDARIGWRSAWLKTTEGLAYLSTLRHWFVKLAPDGSFRISGVPPGDYDLSVEVYAKPTGCLVDPLARQVVRVTVTAADAAKGELKLPEIAAPVKPVPAVGDAPALSYHRADGTAGSLTDVRGRYTLVHFWASWCGPCKQQLPALRRLQERYAAKGLTVLSLSLDEDGKTWQAALKKLDLPWTQGRLDAAEDGGVSSVPEYWLLDADGKIVSKVYDPDELISPVAERLK